MTNACTIAEPMNAIAPPMTSSIATSTAASRQPSHDATCLARVSGRGVVVLPEYATLGRPEAARRGRRENRSCWGVSRLPLPAGSHSCEWAELPRELSTVSHSGQADAQRDPGAEREEQEAYDLQGLGDDWRTVVNAGRSRTCADLDGKLRAPSREAPRHEIHRQRGAACDRLKGFCNALEAELGLRKSDWWSPRTSD